MLTWKMGNVRQWKEGAATGKRPKEPDIMWYNTKDIIKFRLLLWLFRTDYFYLWVYFF